MFFGLPGAGGGIFLAAADEDREAVETGLQAGEESGRVLQVVDRGYEEGVARLPGQDAGEGGQIAHPAVFLLHGEDAEHLAPGEFLLPVGARGEVGFHLLGCGKAEGMGRVAERVGEEPGQGQAGNVGAEGVDHAFGAWEGEVCGGGRNGAGGRVVEKALHGCGKSAASFREKCCRFLQGALPLFPAGAAAFGARLPDFSRRASRPWAQR